MHSDVLTTFPTHILVLDSDYAARVLEFVKDKSLEELNLFHWKRNFDLYVIIHSSYHYWTNRHVQIKVIKSHCLEESHNLEDRYERLGNEFADLAAKTIAKDQGIVEFFQSRSSLWNYVEKAEHDWKVFYEFCMELYKPSSMLRKLILCPQKPLTMSPSHNVTKIFLMVVLGTRVLTNCIRKFNLWTQHYRAF